MILFDRFLAFFT